MLSNSVCNHTRDKQIGLPILLSLVWLRSELLSLVWLQTELDSTQSYYHYLISLLFSPAISPNYYSHKQIYCRFVINLLTRKFELKTRNFKFANQRKILSFETQNLKRRKSKFWTCKLVLLSFEARNFDFLRACLQRGGGAQDIYSLIFVWSCLKPVTHEQVFLDKCHWQCSYAHVYERQIFFDKFNLDKFYLLVWTN